MKMNEQALGNLISTFKHIQDESGSILSNLDAIRDGQRWLEICEADLQDAINNDEEHLIEALEARLARAKKELEDGVSLIEMTARRGKRVNDMANTLAKGFSDLAEPTEEKVSWKELDERCSRKPSCWSECSVVKVSKNQRNNLLSKLPVIVVDEHTDFAPLESHKNGLPRRFNLVREIEGRRESYYVNTEGYDYCRYAFRHSTPN